MIKHLITAVLITCSACGVANQMPEVRTIKDDFDGSTLHSTFTNQLRNVEPSGNIAELNILAGQLKGSSDWTWIANIKLSRQAGWPELTGLRVKISEADTLQIDQCQPEQVKATAQGYGHISHLESIMCTVNRETVERLANATGAKVRFDAKNGADATLDQINTNAIKDVLNRVDGITPLTTPPR